MRPRVCPRPFTAFFTVVHDPKDVAEFMAQDVFDARVWRIASHAYKCKGRGAILVGGQEGSPATGLRQKMQTKFTLTYTLNAGKMGLAYPMLISCVKDGCVCTLK